MFTVARLFLCSLGYAALGYYIFGNDAGIVIGAILGFLISFLNLARKPGIIRDMYLIMKMTLLHPFSGTEIDLDTEEITVIKKCSKRKSDY